MKNHVKYPALLFLFIFSITNGLNAQIFGNILNKAGEIMVDKLEADLTQKIAEKIAERAYRPIDQAFDTIWQSNLPKDTLTGEVDWDEVNRSYSHMLQNLDATDEVSDTYQFDIMIFSETKDYEGKTHKSNMWFSKTAGIFAMEDLEEGSNNLIICDTNKDLIVLVDTKENTAQAIKGMMALGSKNIEKSSSPMVINKTGKTKKIANHKTDEFKGESEEEKIKFYLAIDFLFDWNTAFGPYLKKFSPSSFQENMEEWGGMVLKSETEIKEAKKKTVYEAKEVKEEVFIFNKSEYKFKSVMEDVN